MDYQTLLSLLLTPLCAVIAAPVFASDVQTGAQDIQPCTKNGGLVLAACVSKAFSIRAAYLLCGVVWILGHECSIWLGKYSILPCNGCFL